MKEHVLTLKSSEKIISFPNTAKIHDKINVGVVNFSSVWGNKQANIEKIEAFIEKAHQSGVNLLLFPEMCVTGYARSDKPDSVKGKMAVSQAESKSGPTAIRISALAVQYNMWIIYGATETITGDRHHAYDSMFACSPDGQIISYQKIQPVEGAWCKSGKTPIMLDTEWGKIALSISDDTFEFPELERIYAGYGCRLILTSNASSRNYDWVNKNSTGFQWYYKNRLESIVSREVIYMASANLTGDDGPKDGNSSAYHFPGGSVVIGPAPWNQVSTYFAGSTDNKEEGLFHAEIDLSQATLTTTEREALFNPSMYSKLYQDLADMQLRGEKLQYTPATTDGPVVAVAKCTARWGDKQANIDMMIDYINQAAEKKVEILVFPETILCGYKYVQPEDNKPCMQHQLAETVPGPTSAVFAECAKKHGMYIIYGMCETKNKQYYNSAAICLPDGKQLSYQKITPCGDENYWAVPGSLPMILDTKWGKIGINICMDGHFEPELGRYYAAKGCLILLHPTTTTGNNWYRVGRMGSYTDRDGLGVVTTNTTGTDGPPDKEKEFWSTSLIITKYLDDDGTISYDYDTGSAISLNDTATDGFDINGSPIDKQGLSVAKMNLTGLGFNLPHINAQLYADEYQKLASYIESTQTDFFDISANTAKADIRKVYKTGLMNGTSANTFSPNKPITRAELASIIARLC